MEDITNDKDLYYNQKKDLITPDLQSDNANWCSAKYIQEAISLICSVGCVATVIGLSYGFIRLEQYKGINNNLVSIATVAGAIFATYCCYAVMCYATFKNDINSPDFSDNKKIYDSYDSADC